MNVAELRQKIKNGDLCGAFLFAGEEDYLKRHYLGELRRKIITDEGLAPFMHYVFEGTEPDFGALSDAVRTPSMFADGKLIEWHGAVFEGAKEKMLDALSALAEEVRQSGDTTLVFLSTPEGLDVGTDANHPSKSFSAVSAVLSAIPFFRSGDRELCGWISRHFSAEGVDCTPSLPTSLLGRVGHDMSVLSSEIDKLTTVAKARGLEQITEKEMEEVCIRTVESDAFSFTNALLDGKTEEAYRYLFDMERRRVDPILALGQVARLYGDLLSVALLAEEGLSPDGIAKKLRMHEYKAKLYFRAAQKCGVAAIERNLALCAEIDASMKSGSASYIGLERLVAAGTAI